LRAARLFLNGFFFEDEEVDFDPLDEPFVLLITDADGVAAFAFGFGVFVSAIALCSLPIRS
jgi:hypothetical protein